MYKNKEWLQNNINNKTDLEIALECNVSEITISRWRKKFNLERDAPKYQNKDWLIDQLKEHGSATSVALANSYNVHTVNSWCLKFGISTKQREELKNGTLVEGYFKNIDTEHKAYWLGFLMADGMISKDLSRLYILLGEKDECILEAFKKDIGSDALIKDRTGGFGTHCKELTICNKSMCADLIYHGIVPRKTGKETLPDTIPTELIRHFIRGFMDGDGCIRRDSKYASSLELDFAGTSYNIFHSIHDYFVSQNIIEHDIKISKEANSKCMHLNYYSSNATKVLDHLYENATIYLQRKYDNFIDSPAS